LAAYSETAAHYVSAYSMSDIQTVTARLVLTTDKVRMK